DPRDPSAVNKSFVYPEPEKDALRRRRPRIGVFKGATDKIQPEVKKNFEESLKVLAKFAEVVEGVELPNLPFGEVVGTIIKAEGASAFRELLESGKASKLRDPDDHWGGYAASM